MSITVRNNVERHLRGDVTLLVRSPEPPGRLAVALAAAAAEIRVTGGDWRSAPNLVPGSINGPAYVSDPVPVPGGHLITIDFKDTPAPARRTVPGIVAKHLQEAHVAEAEIGLAPQMSNGRFTFLQSLAPVARAWLLGRIPPGGDRSLQPWLVDLALDWLRNRYQADMTLLALLGATEVPLAWDSARLAVDAFLTARSFPMVLESDFKTAGMGANLREFYGPGIALNMARADWPAAQTAEAMRAHRETIRAHASLPGLRWAGATGYSDMYSASSPAHAWDESGLEPMWYQILSQEQLARLGEPPPGSVTLPGGRVELTVGEPEQWLPRHPDRLAIGSQAARLLGTP
jgi:hypothetical protein